MRRGRHNRRVQRRHRADGFHLGGDSGKDHVLRQHPVGLPQYQVAQVRHQKRFGVLDRHRQYFALFGFFDRQPRPVGRGVPCIGHAQHVGAGKCLAADRTMHNRAVMAVHHRNPATGNRLKRQAARPRVPCGKAEQFLRTAVGRHPGFQHQAAARHHGAIGHVALGCVVVIKSKPVGAKATFAGIKQCNPSHSSGHLLCAAPQVRFVMFQCPARGGGIALAG